MPGVGTGKKEELLAWKRGGAGPLATVPSPMTNKVPKGSREIPLLDSGSPLRLWDTTRQGPTLGASVKQAS